MQRAKERALQRLREVEEEKEKAMADHREDRVAESVTANDATPDTGTQLK